MLFVLVCCALGAAGTLGLPVTTFGFSIILILIAASAVALVATRPRSAAAPVRRTP